MWHSTAHILTLFTVNMSLVVLFYIFNFIEMLVSFDFLPPIMSLAESSNMVKVHILRSTMCPGSSDPFYIVSYYINRSLLPGQIVY